MNLSSRLRSSLSAILLGALLVPTAASAAMKVEGKPKVAFFAQGNPGALDIEGVTDQIAAKDDGTSLTFDVPLDSISTGIDLRDDHMKKNFLETGKFPNATITLPKGAIAWPAELKQEVKGTMKADFTAHGVTAPVEVTYAVKKSKTGWRVQASFPFDISQHGLTVPDYLGVTVDPKMKTQVTFDLVDAP